MGFAGYFAGFGALRAVPFRTPTARLALKPVSPSPGHVEPDGAWWPRSRDLTHELSALADVLDPLWGRITHIAVNPRHWPILPRKILVNGHVVKAGWFTSEQDPHDRRLQRRGRIDRVSGSLKQAVQKTKDTFRRNGSGPR
nr:DUF5994 family protein [Streptomyces panaciradicis]